MLGVDEERCCYREGRKEMVVSACEPKDQRMKDEGMKKRIGEGKGIRKTRRAQDWDIGIGTAGYRRC